MAITIKKKLTVKTVKAKPSSVLPDAAPAEATPQVAASPVESAAAVPAVVAAPIGKPASYVFAGICAILATICFLALLLLQWLEWDFYQGAFPVGSPAPGSGLAAPSRPLEAMPLTAPATPTLAPTPADEAK